MILRFTFFEASMAPVVSDIQEKASRKTRRKERQRFMNKYLRNDMYLEDILQSVVFLFGRFQMNNSVSRTRKRKNCRQSGS